MKAAFVDPAKRRLEVKEAGIPVPGKSEVLVKILASSLNPSDLAKISEIDEEMMPGFIPGTEACGIIVGCGKGLLPRLLLNKRVSCISHHQGSGAWAEYMVTKAGNCFPVSRAITDTQAAMMLVNPLTALALTDIAVKGRHKAVVITAASGALGKMLNSLMKKKRIKVINVVSDSNKQASLKKEGMTEVLNSGDSDFLRQLTECIVRLQPSLVLDAAGGGMINQMLDILPEGADFILYGNLSKQKIEFMPTSLVRTSKKMRGFFLGHWISEAGLLKTILFLIKANRLIKRGMTTKINKVFKLDEINDAVSAYQKNMTGGKVLISFES